MDRIEQNRDELDLTNNVKVNIQDKYETRQDK